MLPILAAMLRTLFAILLSLTLPLSGVAAGGVADCSARHADPAQSMSSPSSTADEHAHHAMHAAAQSGHDSCPSASAPPAKADGASCDCSCLCAGHCVSSCSFAVPPLRGGTDTAAANTALAAHDAGGVPHGAYRLALLRPPAPSTV